MEGSSLVLKNITIINAFGDYGGAICNMGNLTVTDSIFMYNMAIRGSSILSTGPLTVNNTEFSENMAQVGGAIYVYDNIYDVTILNSHFSKNIVNTAGAVEVYDNYHRNKGRIIIDSNIFNDNSAIHGGVLDIVHSVTVSNNKFTNNKASTRNTQKLPFGGAISLDQDNEELEFTANITRNTFTDNYVEDGIGGSIYINNGIFSYISDNTFKNNYAVDGGALFTYSNVNITDNIFINNTATKQNTTSEPNGAAIELRGSDNQEVIAYSNNNIFIDNTAEYTGRGGAIHVSSNACLNSFNDTFRNNKACWGEHSFLRAY